MKNKQLKKIGLAFSILVVAVGVFFCGRYIVQAVADNVYVEGDPINITEDEIYLTKPSKDKSVVSVTSSNGVMLPELPKCDDGRVFLEITPDSSTQVLTWLSANNSVISDEELTRRISLVGKGPVKDQNITNGDDVLQPVMGLSYNRFNVWNPEIDLYEKDKDGNYVHEDILKRAEKIKEESTPTNDKGEPIPDDQLTPEQKKKIKEALEEYIKEKCYVDMSLYSVKDKYVLETNAEFGVGPDFEGVSQTALSDKYNWDKEVVEKKTENNGKKTKGYFVRMNGPSDEGVVLDVANKTAAPDSNQSWIAY